MVTNFKQIEMNVRRILFGSIILAMAACTGNQKNQSDNGNSDANTITVDELLANADTYANKEVIVKGTVTHVCRHGGQRLFIIGSDPDNRLKITTGPSISEFTIELEGSTVEISGKLDEERIDENYLTTWEEEVKAKSEKDEHAEGVGIHDGDHTNNQQEELEKINKYRAQIKASGKDHISFYSVVCDSYKQL